MEHDNTQSAQSEAAIERWLGKQIKQMGGLYMKFTSPGNIGVPDRIIILPGGKMLFVELKTSTGRLTTMQVFQINRLRALGCDARVVYGMRGARQLKEEFNGED